MSSRTVKETKALAKIAERRLVEQHERKTRHPAQKKWRAPLFLKVWLAGRIFTKNGSMQ